MYVCTLYNGCYIFEIECKICLFFLTKIYEIGLIDKIHTCWKKKTLKTYSSLKMDVLFLKFAKKDFSI